MAIKPHGTERYSVVLTAPDKAEARQSWYTICLLLLYPDVTDSFVTWLSYVF